MPFTQSTINHPLDSTFFGAVEDLLDESTATEHDTLMIACSDHRTAPDNGSVAPPGRIMILQHLAASIPSAIECDKGLDIEGTTRIMGEKTIRHIIECGTLAVG